MESRPVDSACSLSRLGRGAEALFLMASSVIRQCAVECDGGVRASTGELFQSEVYRPA
jgi:hypothetical protein